MKMYREWTTALNSRCGNMMPVDLFDKILTRRDSGYQGVYMFSEDVALDIIASGSSAGFSRYTPAAQEVIIDLDDGDRQKAALTETLLKHGFLFQVWFSGGKGYHFTIPHQFIQDKRLPYSHLRWVESLGIVADWSLYRPGSIVSLPGRVHPKTKIKKHLLETYDGKPLELPLHEIPDKPEFRVTEVSDDEQRIIGLYKLSKLVAEPPTEGDRHIKLWSCAKNLADGGFSFAAVETILQEINSIWPVPKNREEVLKAVVQAFQARR